jgi:hypothetical protein
MEPDGLSSPLKSPFSSSVLSRQFNCGRIFLYCWVSLVYCGGHLWILSQFGEVLR